MKTVRAAAFLAVVTGFIAWQGKEISVHASSEGSQAVKAAPATSQSTSDNTAGANTYAKNCAMCHGDKRQGNPPAFPSLVGVGSKMTEPEIIARIHNGKGSMPPFPNLQGEELQALVHFLTSPTASTGTAAINQESGPPHAVHTSTMADAGNSLFQRNCSFCHGRDAAGGESGPDLTRSKLVRSDIGGNKISEIVRNGVPGTKMPAFTFSNQEISELTDFIHAAAEKASSTPGGRRGVDVADLQTGNAEAGKRYFNGPGGCAKCHSATGDLAGIASRLEGLQLEEQMLYPKGAKSRVTVTLPSGRQVSGIVEYQDEFTIGLKDSSGIYRSWPTANVKYVLDEPVNAHVEQFSKYTDDDIHNLMAYIQTLR